MESKIKKQMETRIREIITEFERNSIGKSFAEVKSYIIEDIIVTKLKCILTPMEQQLAKDPEGINLIKQCRFCFLEKLQSVLEKTIYSILSVRTISFYKDINVKTGQCFLISSLSENVEAKFKKRRYLRLDKTGAGLVD